MLPVWTSWSWWDSSSSFVTYIMQHTNQVTIPTSFHALPKTKQTHQTLTLSAKKFNTPGHFGNWDLFQMTKLGKKFKIALEIVQN